MTVLPFSAQTQLVNPNLESKLDPAQELLDVATGLHESGVLDDAALLAHRAMALEMSLGIKLLSLRPTLHGFKTPTQIANELDLTANRVGRTITELGLREAVSGQATRVLHRLDDRLVLGWAYSPSAVAKISDALTREKAA